jgi:hypothetical protein
MVADMESYRMSSREFEIYSLLIRFEAESDRAGGVEGLHAGGVYSVV